MGPNAFTIRAGISHSLSFLDPFETLICCRHHATIPRGSVYVGGGPAMDTRRSFYLASRQDDFAELAVDASQLDVRDMICVVSANDNLRTKERLSARCGSLLRRLIALHWVVACPH